VAVHGFLSPPTENDADMGRFRAGKVIAFVLATILLAVATMLLPATASAVEAVASNPLTAEIEKSVMELGYPKDVARDLVRLVRDWKWGVWRQMLSQARQTYQEKLFVPADVARVEEEVIRGLAQTIGRRITLDSDPDSKCFYLSKVLKDRKAQCLGCSQLVYILGNSLGLRVTAIGVLELASGPLPTGNSHAACCVELANGKVMMVDVAQNIMSNSFVFLETYRAAGNYWELKQQDNPLRVPRRIQIWNKSGLCAAIYNNLGNAYREAGDHTQAMLCFTKAIELNPKDAVAHCNRGTAYNRAGQLANALADYTKAIELDPKCAQAYSNRGTAYDRSGQLTNAFSDYAKAIELNPRLAQVYCNRGTAYSRLGQLANALADYTKAIELDPKLAQAFFTRGIVYAEMGKTDEAAKDLQKAVELKPSLREQVEKASDQFKLGL
jgi:tetratricopeptide (TPR) repeat protein